MTRSERDELVGRIHGLRERLEEALWEGVEGGGETAAEIRAELAEAHQVYADALPETALSRCPFTGVLVEQAIDPWGLDGPWWDAEWPVRRWAEAPSSLLVLSGAMTLTEPLERVAHLAMPGPQVPCVDSSMLARPGAVAVVHSMNIGLHTGFPIAYFEDPPMGDPPTLNTWGSRRWMPSWEELAVELEIVEEEDQLDPNLEPWIRAGKLMWIVAGDPEMRLHATVSGCPYLGLGGETAPSRILDGRLVESEP